MAISAPRQRTTFKKDKKTGKVKGTTTYRAPERESADEQLDRYIRDNQNKKNQSAGIKSIVTDMPSKFAEGFDFDANDNLVNPTPGKKSKYFRKDGSLNQAGKYILGVYSDERPEYSRGLNRLVKSSPEMAQAYARRFPLTNAAMNIIPRFLPVIGPAFTADQAMKANRRKQEILNTPVNRPDGGFKNFVDFFAKGMTPDQRKNTEIISGESLRLAPQDIFNKSQPMTKEQKANVAADLPFRSPQDMGFLDDENIFDTEKAAIDAALTPGNIVYNPVEDDFRGKVNFINQALDGANYPYDQPNDPAYRPMIEQLFERVKRNIGYKEIRPTVDADNAQAGDGEDPIPGGQFDLTNPAFSDQTNLVLSGDPEYDFTNYDVNQELGNVIPTDNMFLEGGVSGTPVTKAGQELIFTDGTPVTKPVDTGLNTPAGQAAIDILNSNATNDVKRSFVDDNYGMTNPDIFMNDQRFDTIDYGFADGGSTNKYENMSTHEKLMRMAAEMYG